MTGKPSDTHPEMPDNDAELEAFKDEQAQDASERSYNDAKARSDANDMYESIMDKDKK